MTNIWLPGIFLLIATLVQGVPISTKSCDSTNCVANPDTLKCTPSARPVDGCCPSYTCVDNNGGTYTVFGSTKRTKDGTSVQQSISIRSGSANGNVQSRAVSSASSFGGLPPSVFRSMGAPDMSGFFSGIFGPRSFPVPADDINMVGDNMLPNVKNYDRSNAGGFSWAGVIPTKGARGDNVDDNNFVSVSTSSGSPPEGGSSFASFGAVPWNNVFQGFPFSFVSSFFG